MDCRSHQDQRLRQRCACLQVKNLQSLSRYVLVLKSNIISWQRNQYVEIVLQLVTNLLHMKHKKFMNRKPKNNNLTLYWCIINLILFSFDFVITFNYVYFVWLQVGNMRALNSSFIITLSICLFAFNTLNWNTRSPNPYVVIKFWYVCYVCTQNRNTSSLNQTLALSLHPNLIVMCCTPNRNTRSSNSSFFIALKSYCYVLYTKQGYVRSLNSSFVIAFKLNCFVLYPK